MTQNSPENTQQPNSSLETKVEANNPDSFGRFVWLKLNVARKTLPEAQYKQLEAEAIRISTKYYQERQKASQDTKKDVQKLQQELSKFNETEISFWNARRMFGMVWDKEKDAKIQNMIRQHIEWKTKCWEDWIAGYSNDKWNYAIKIENFETELLTKWFENIHSVTLANYFIRIKTITKSKEEFIERIALHVRSDVLQKLLQTWWLGGNEKLWKNTLEKSEYSEVIKLYLRQAGELHKRLDSLNLNIDTGSKLNFIKEVLPAAIKWRDYMLKTLNNPKWKDVLKNENIENILTTLYEQAHTAREQQQISRWLRLWTKLMKNKSIANIAKRLHIKPEDIINGKKGAQNVLSQALRGRKDIQLTEEENTHIQIVSAECRIWSDLQCVKEQPEIKKAYEAARQKSWKLPRKISILLDAKNDQAIIVSFAQEKGIDLNSKTWQEVFKKDYSVLHGEYISSLETTLRIEKSINNSSDTSEKKSEISIEKKSSATSAKKSEEKPVENNKTPKDKEISDSIDKLSDDKLSEKVESIIIEWNTIKKNDPKFKQGYVITAGVDDGREFKNKDTLMAAMRMRCFFNKIWLNIAPLSTLEKVLEKMNHESGSKNKIDFSKSIPENSEDYLRLLNYFWKHLIPDYKEEGRAEIAIQFFQESTYLQAHLKNNSKWNEKITSISNLLFKLWIQKESWAFDATAFKKIFNITN